MNADRVIEFARKYCTISRGNAVDQPFEFLPWQTKIVRDIFDSVVADNGRVVKRALISTAKKQGKSAFVAVLALYFLMADDEPSPLVVVGAVTREQAAEVFNDILYFVNANPTLKRLIKPVPSQKKLLYKNKNGRLLCLSADAPSKQGLDCSAVILDEVGMMPDSKLYDVLRYATAGRPARGIQIYLSNAGCDRSHFYYTVYRYFKDCAAGTITDPSAYSYIAEVPEEADYSDEKLWPLANPSLGVTFSLQDMRRDFQAAKIAGPAEELKWRRWFCNQWTSKYTGWIDLRQWDLCKTILPSLESFPCYVACDLSSSIDLTSIAAVWCAPAGLYYVKSWNTAPRAALERREKSNLTRYTHFLSDGSLEISEGEVLDYEEQRDKLDRIIRQTKPKGVIFDRWAARVLEQHLTRQGVPVFDFPQHAKWFSEPVKRAFQLVADRKLLHDGNLCLRWGIGNVCMETDDKGFQYPSRKRSVDKIDPAVSLLMALSSALQDSAHPDEEPSIYETQGLFFVGGPEPGSQNKTSKNVLEVSR